MSVTPSRQPVLFLGHGAPPLIDDPVWTSELRAWGEALPRPHEILVVSAHWEARPPTVGATRTVPLVYDFYGFPERYYKIRYPSPGAPELGARVRAMLREAKIGASEAQDRGLDHGVYVPLLYLFPDASVPVIQLSMPSLNPADLFALGRALAPLRDEGVLLIGSGFLTHNLRQFGNPVTQPWAVEFDAWAASAIAARDHEALIDVMARAPSARLAHPALDHYVPLLFSAGASNEADAIGFPVTGFWMGSFSKRSVQYG